MLLQLKKLAKKWINALRSRKQNNAALAELVESLSREVSDLGIEIRQLRGERDQLFQDIREIMLQKCGDVHSDRSIEVTPPPIPPRNTSTPELFAERNWETWKPPMPKMQRAATYPPLHDETAEIFFDLLQTTRSSDRGSGSSGSINSGGSSPRHRTAWRTVDRQGRTIPTPKVV